MCMSGTRCCGHSHTLRTIYNTPHKSKIITTYDTYKHRQHFSTHALRNSTQHYK